MQTMATDFRRNLASRGTSAAALASSSSSPGLNLNMMTVDSPERGPDQEQFLISKHLRVVHWLMEQNNMSLNADDDSATYSDIYSTHSSVSVPLDINFSASERGYFSPWNRNGSCGCTGQLGKRPTPEGKEVFPLAARKTVPETDNIHARNLRCTSTPKKKSQLNSKCWHIWHHHCSGKIEPVSEIPETVGPLNGDKRQVGESASVSRSKGGCGVQIMNGEAKKRGKRNLIGRSCIPKSCLKYMDDHNNTEDCQPPSLDLALQTGVFYQEPTFSESSSETCLKLHAPISRESHADGCHGSSKTKNFSDGDGRSAKDWSTEFDLPQQNAMMVGDNCQSQTLKTGSGQQTARTLSIAERLTPIRRIQLIRKLRNFAICVERGYGLTMLAVL